MKKYLDVYFRGLVSGLGILSVIGLTGIAYGAYVAMTDVTTGQTLTASTFNQVLENVRVLRTDVDKSSPAGAIMAFNLSSCPTGWIAANGANGTPDLRGEFIRGLDSGRGVDSGRTLSSSQNSSEVPMDYGPNGVLPLTSVVNPDYVVSYSVGYREVTGAWSTSNINISYLGIRPRNVALLYCVKQ